jgi:hypothetical protein
MLPFISELRLESTMIDINYYICLKKNMSEKRLKRKKLHSKLFTKTVWLSWMGYFWNLFFKVDSDERFVVATIGAILLISITTLLLHLVRYESIFRIFLYKT